MPKSREKELRQKGRAMRLAEEPGNFRRIVRGYRYGPYTISEYGLCSCPEFGNNLRLAKHEQLTGAADDYTDGCEHILALQHINKLIDLHEEYRALAPEEQEVWLKGYADQARLEALSCAQPARPAKKTGRQAPAVRVFCTGNQDWMSPHGVRRRSYTFSLNGVSQEEALQVAERKCLALGFKPGNFKAVLVFEDQTAVAKMPPLDG